MIGIVIVSHSARLAEGVLELARGMAGEDVRIAAAGGLDLPDRPIGTDPALVARAIESVYSEDGVVVLMDLGSAVLSAEMALDLLPPEMRSRIVLSDAPLVEGAVSAAVQARLGSPIAQVAAEARGALAFKTDHLQPETQAAEAAPASPGDEVRSLRLEVSNRLGLHARPAARFVQTAGRFPGVRLEVRNLTTGKGPVQARSINAIATLGVLRGHAIEILASGPEADQALAAFQALADVNFGDADGPERAPATDVAPPAQRPEGAPPSALGGLAGSPGIAIGPARRLHARRATVPSHRIEDPAAEWVRLEEALDWTRRRIERTLAEVSVRADRQAAEIFEAHRLFLEDPALREPAREMILTDHRNAAEAWMRASEAVAEGYRALEDDYLRGRAVDVMDVAQQVVSQLLGEAETGPALEAPGILVAPDLTPAATARLDPSLVKGICTAGGSPTSHSAILARTFGIPAVVGLGEGILALSEGLPLVVDADRGWVIPDPGEEVLRDYAARLDAQTAAAAEALAGSAAPAASRDGYRIEVGANVGTPAEARAALAAGAEGIGLLRTEFLYLGRTEAPGEEEQFQAYRTIAEAMEGRPVIIRTLDIGGDKPLPYIDLGPEANPFLGWRAIRLCLARPELFKTQLRAVLRTAALHPVKVMFPMVATLEELRAAKVLLAEARDEARARGYAVADRLETGIMVEIPAAAIRAGQLAPEVDFFSIGTNDLTQYTLAAERGNPRVAGLADPCHPAVLELVQRVAEAAHAHGKWVGICGELAGDPAAVPILLGLGIDELSMSAPAIPRVKQVVRSLALPDARALAARALAAETAADVRRAAQGPA